VHEYTVAPMDVSTVNEQFGLVELQDTTPVGDVSTAAGHAGRLLFPDVHCQTLDEHAQSYVTVPSVTL